MTREAAELLKKALDLPAEDRADLVSSLLESLDQAPEDSASVKAAWNEEIARRVADLDSGKAKTIPWKEVRNRVAAKLANAR